MYGKLFRSTNRSWPTACAGVCFGVFVGLAALVSCDVRAARAEVTAQQVRDALNSAVAFLKDRQNQVDGSWGDPPGQPGGLTSLVTLALISAGEEPSSPAIQKALGYLEALGNPKMTYATSLQTMVFCAADPRKYQARIGENARWLESTQMNGDRAGAWAYSGRQGGGDNSNSQFALLALFEAERAGVKISDKTWRAAYDYWKSQQNQDGSWRYSAGDAPSGSMTCAGIASLVIASGRVASGNAAVRDGRVQCCGADDDDDVQQRIERGLQWLGTHFRVDGNPSAGGIGSGGGFSRLWHFYYLYGMERVGRMTGRRHFVGYRTIDGRKVAQPHDWYREGAEFLIREQDKTQRYWKAQVGTEANPVVATALAVLFLSKGRRPVVISKLKHGDDWDSHRAGIPNLTRRVELRWKRDLSWQTVDMRAASVEDLLESPILFLSGRQAVELTADQKDRLRRYVSQGGFLFIEACDGQGCDGREFDRAIREHLRDMFPDSSLRLLPPDHPVWFAEQKVNPNHLRPLWGLDTCCRTSVVYCPQTLSCYWDLLRFERGGDYPDEIAAEIESVVRIGENVVAYATNRELKDKLDRPAVATAATRTPVTRGTLFVPKIAHGGGADEATNALPNLLKFFGQKAELSVASETRLIAPTDEGLLDYPIVFMHGRRAFKFTAAERQALAAHLQRGGFLLADAICASGEFTESFRSEIKAMFPDSKLVRITSSHPLMTPEFRGFDITTVTLRDPQARGGDDPLVARNVKAAPLLEGLEIDGRLAVIFSPYDLSCALENHASLDCKGYLKADAAKIGVNVLLYALQQ